MSKMTKGSRAKQLFIFQDQDVIVINFEDRQKDRGQKPAICPQILMYKPLHVTFCHSVLHCY